VSFDYSIGAVFREGTPIVPEGMLLAPGEYQAVLDVDGKRQQAKLSVIADPRTTLDPAAVRETVALARDVAAALETDYVGYGQLHAVDAQLAKIDTEQASPPLRTAIEAYRQASEPLRAAKGPDSENLEAIGGLLASLVTDLEGSDRMPTQPQRELLASAQQRLQRATEHWQRVQTAELAQLNAQLRSAGSRPLAVPAPADVRLDDAPESKDLP